MNDEQVAPSNVFEMPPETDRAPVWSRPPPDWVIHHVTNPLMRRLLPGPVGRWIPGMAVLRFEGRHSGTSYTVPIGVYDHGNHQVVFTEAPWSANFRDGWPVEVVRRGETISGSGELVTDPGYIGPAIRAQLAAGTSKMMLGLAIDRGHYPTDEELAAIRRAVVIHT